MLIRDVNINGMFGSAMDVSDVQALRLRVMTYNIHGCVNRFRRISPLKTAEIIGGLNADIIALQEVDAEESSTDQTNQAKILADELNMSWAYFPVETDGLHKFGLAILSRFQIVKIHVSRLPNLYPMLKPRKRGAMQATISTPVGPIYLVNTHLSVFKLERRRQINALLSHNWPVAAIKDNPVIFCGDLNAGSISFVYRRLIRRLIDVQTALNDPMLPKPTFHSHSPIFRIDHIFTSKHFSVNQVTVPNSVDCREASDHLPVIAELTLPASSPFSFS